MASELSLADYAGRPRSGRGWIDGLPDDVFNQVWDARHGGNIGKDMAAAWLGTVGYDDATGANVETILTRERR